MLNTNLITTRKTERDASDNFISKPKFLLLQLAIPLGTFRLVDLALIVPFLFVYWIFMNYFYIILRKFDC